MTWTTEMITWLRWKGSFSQSTGLQSSTMYSLSRISQKQLHSFLEDIFFQSPLEKLRVLGIVETNSYQLWGV